MYVADICSLSGNIVNDVVVPASVSGVSYVILNLCFSNSVFELVDVKSQIVLAIVIIGCGWL